VTPAVSHTDFIIGDQARAELRVAAATVSVAAWPGVARGGHTAVSLPQLQEVEKQQRAAAR